MDWILRYIKTTFPFFVTRSSKSALLFTRNLKLLLETTFNFVMFEKLCVSDDVYVCVRE